MSPSLTEIAAKLGTEPVAGIAAYTDAPEQRGGFPPPPQPGRYVFQLPSDLSNVWHALEDIAVPGGAEGQTQTYLQVRFSQDHPLQIVGADTRNQGEVGEPFMPALSNIPRNRGRKGENPEYFSDFDYLLLKSFGLMERPAHNQAYAQQLMQHAGQRFSATIAFNWYQGTQKSIWTMIGPTGAIATAEEVQAKQATPQECEGIKVLEKIAYYQNDVGRGPDGKYPLQLGPIAAEIGGQTYHLWLRANAQLEQFGPAPQVTAEGQPAT